MAFNYPITNFHFKVECTIPDNVATKWKKHKINFSGDDNAFQSVTGLDVKTEFETVKEGGELRFEHKLPKRSTYTNLTLKRSIGLPTDSGLTDWCKKAFEERIYLPLDLQIMLLDESHQALAYWNVNYAWPFSWNIGELNAEDGKVLIETIVLTYNFFTFKKVG